MVPVGPQATAPLLDSTRSYVYLLPVQPEHMPDARPKHGP